MMLSTDSVKTGGGADAGCWAGTSQTLAAQKTVHTVRIRRIAFTL
jgi:hypothetical protein